MSKIPQTIQTVKYAGSKVKLLDFLMSEFNSHLSRDALFVDLFAGTCSVSYALKSTNRLFCNDVQAYSKTIADALIKNNHGLKKGQVLNEIEPLLGNQELNQFNLFTTLYSDTYFTEKQCKEIDQIRGAIESLSSKWKRDLYLVALLHSMSYCASTTGHFAEYLSKKKDTSIKQRFIEKCDLMDVVKGANNNVVTCYDYQDLFRSKYKKILEKADLIYADPPYSGAQYSRFYHVLETAVKYDYPEIEFKGKYRKDRFFSNFSRKTKVRSEFNSLFESASSTNATFMLSYVNHGRGLLTENELLEIARKYYLSDKIKVKRKRYDHSTLGNKGRNEVQEFLVICKGSI